MISSMDLGRELNSFIFLSSDMITIDYSTKQVIYLIHCPKGRELNNLIICVC